MFKSLGKQAGTLAVPPYDLEQIATPSPKHKQMTGKRILRQNLFGLCCQRIESTPHVRYASRKPDPRIARHRDHDDNPFSKRASISTSKLPSADTWLLPSATVIVLESDDRQKISAPYLALLDDGVWYLINVGFGGLMGSVKGLYSSFDEIEFDFPTREQL